MIRLIAMLTVSSPEPSAEGPEPDVVNTRVTVIGSSQGGSGDMEQMFLATAVLVRTMHTELTAKQMKMKHNLNVAEDDLKCALRTRDAAERACGKANKACKAMKQDHRDLQRQLRQLRQQGRGADPDDVHVEGESAEENDDVTMTSTSQEDVTGD